MVVNAVNTHKNHLYLIFFKKLDQNGSINARYRDKYCPSIYKTKSVNKYWYLLQTATKSNNLFCINHLFFDVKVSLDPNQLYYLSTIAKDSGNLYLANWYDNNYDSSNVSELNFDIGNIPIKYFVDTNNNRYYELFEETMAEKFILPTKLRYVLKLLKENVSQERYKFIINRVIEQCCDNLAALQIIDEIIPNILKINQIGDNTHDVAVFKWTVMKGYKNFDKKSKRYKNPNQYETENLDKIINYLKQNSDDKTFEYNGKYPVCPISYICSDYENNDPVLLEYEYPLDIYIYV
jgi:hypothetical protein